MTGRTPCTPPDIYYPEPAVRILDHSFERYRLIPAGVERIATGFRFNEGPVWFSDWRSLIWSDIPANTMYRWSEETGQVEIFRKPSGHANGNTRDRQGRLVTAEHSGRRDQPNGYDGSITVLAETIDGKRLNSPE